MTMTQRKIASKIGGWMTTDASKLRAAAEILSTVSAPYQTTMAESLYSRYPDGNGIVEALRALADSLEG